MQPNLILLFALLAGLESSARAAPFACWSLSPTEGGRILDQVGQSHGLLRGEAPTPVTGGPAAAALSIEDGLTYVVVPHREEVSLRNDFAITVLLKPATVDGYRTLLWKGDRAGKPERIQFLVDLNAGKVEFKAKDENGEWTAWRTREPCVRPNLWVLLRVEFNSGSCRIQVNGADCPLIAPKSTSAALHQLVANTDPLYFGLGQTAAGNPGYGFSGILADIIFSPAAENRAENSLLARIAQENLANQLGDASRFAEVAARQTHTLRERLSDTPGGLAPDQTALLLAEGLAIRRRVNETADSLLRADLSDGHLPSTSKATTAVSNGDGLPDVLQAVIDGLDRLHGAEQALGARLIGPEVAQGKPVIISPTLAAAVEKELNEVRSQLESWIARAEGHRREAGLFASGARFAAIPCSQGITLDRSRGALARIPENTGATHVQMARNEREGLQVLILPKPGAAGQLTINFAASAFAPANGGRDLPPPELAPMKTVSNRLSETPVDFRGDIFDIIMEGERQVVLAEDAPSAVFVRFSAAPNTVAGLYRGTIHFSSGLESHDVEIEITVSDFALPQDTSLRAAFSFSEMRYRDWFPSRQSSDSVQRRIADFVRSYRLASSDIYHPDIFPDPKQTPVANFYTLGFYGPHRPPQPDAVDREVAALRTRWDAARSAGVPPDRIYLYSWDEYGTFDKLHFEPATVRRYMDLVKATLPELKRMQTSLPRPPFENWWNVWVPLIGDFRRMNPDILKAPETEIWWYWVSDPRPYPNFFLGYPAHESRMALLLGYKYHLKGCLYWCINREWSDNSAKVQKWPEAEWEAFYVNTLSKKAARQSGQGNLCYPGTGGNIWPSLRLENIRDGIEDFEYLALLERLASEIHSGKRPGANDQLKEIDSLLAIPDEVVASTSRWTKDPAVLAGFRGRVAAMIEKVQAQR